MPDRRIASRVLERWERVPPWGRTAVALGILALAFTLPLRGLLRSQGPPMEEGFMLVFPERVLAGDVPNLDFLHLYGPGSLWVLAAVYKVFGVSLATERVFGLVQQVGLVLAVFGLARFWGRTAALGCALISLVIIVPPIGLTALAWTGGVALALLGLLAILHGRRRLEAANPAALRLATFGGAVAGFSLLYRLDLAVAVGAAGLAAIWGTSRRFQLRAAVGTALGVAGYVVHLAMAGPGNVVRGMVLEPVFDLRGGRKLPVPPPWDHLDGFLQRSGAILPPRWPLPHLSSPQQLFVWFFVLIGAVVLLLAVAAWDVRRDPARLQARVLLTVAIFSAGMLPQAMQRVDSAHFAWVSCVPFAFLPIAILELRGARRGARRPMLASLLATGGVLLVMILVIPHFTAWSYGDYVAQSFGRHRLAFRIERNGRIFYYGRDDVQRAAQALLAKVPEVANPGDRLLVGTTDLRKTPLSEAYLYYLLPELTPSTYYIEMDPGVANAEDSRLADDLAGSDVAILSGVWNDWEEPNDSRKVGSDAANRVLKRDFCLVEQFGQRADGGALYELWRRCER
ncbi:MAG: hypothetical protein FJW88_06110 [Actinobacteria bacterium]|nr:hypothetical protein [Actinomycetota bacterium]